MVRTGRRAAALADLIRATGVATVSERLPAPRLNDLDDAVAESITRLHRSFGGDELSLLRPGPWDLVFEGPLTVELDEELHFNRYRAATLEPEWMAALPWQDAYTALCVTAEPLCLSSGSWGKRWITASSEAMFGAAEPPGQLNGRGAPRWKQRALYDAIKDGYAEGHSGGVARLSVHDPVCGVSLGQVLEGRASVPPEAIADLLQARTA